MVHRSTTKQSVLPCVFFFPEIAVVSDPISLFRIFVGNFRVIWNLCVTNFVLMYRKQRLTAAVPSECSSQRQRVTSSPSSEVVHSLPPADLEAAISSLELPIIGPITTNSHRAQVSSWPQNLPKKVSTSLSPTAPSTLPPLSNARVPVALSAMIRKHEMALQCSVNPDIESIVAMQFHILDECCRQLGKCFPSYREVYSGMQRAVSQLNDSFGELHSKNHNLVEQLNNARSAAEEMARTATAERMELTAWRSQLVATESKANQDSDTIRVVSTQNEDLFDQLQKMRRKVTEADEISQQMTSRNVVLQVNQGRLEHEVERLQSALASAIAQHEAERVIVEQRNRTIEALENKLISSESRLEVMDTSLSKTTAELRSMMDVNKTLSANLQRVQVQLNSLIERSASPNLSSTSRTSSPRTKHRFDLQSSARATTSAAGADGSSTPRPDWSAIHSAFAQPADARLAAQLKEAASSKDKVRCILGALQVYKQRAHALEADLAAMKMQRQANAEPEKH